MIFEYTFGSDMMEYQDFFPDEVQKKLIELFPICHLHIRGIAGSGKTRIAIAKYQYLLQHGISEVNILFLTYNNVLANYVNSFLGKEIAKTYHKLIRPYLYPNCSIRVLSNENERLQFISRAINFCQQDGKIPFCKKHDEAFFFSEFDFINDFGLSKEKYLDKNTKRCGRPRILSENRNICFKIYETYNEIKEKSGYQYDWSETAKVAYEKLSQGIIKPDKKYDFIIIDEAQDFSFSMLKSLSYFLSNPQEGFILFSDSAQQVYGKRISFKSLNMGKFYRPKRLMVNYRNSQCIRQFAQTITKTKRWSGSGKEVDQVKDYSRVPVGEKPVYIRLSSEKTIWQLLQFVKMMRIIDPPAKIGIGTYLKKQDPKFSEVLDVERLYSALKSNGEEVQNLKIYGNGFDSSCPISVGTFHSMKGLEFDYVIMIIPDNKVIVQYTTDSDVVRERKENFTNLSYMVSTRAKKQLYMFWQSDGEDAVPEAFSCTQGYKWIEFDDIFNILFKK